MSRTGRKSASASGGLVCLPPAKTKRESITGGLVSDAALRAMFATFPDKIEAHLTNEHGTPMILSGPFAPMRAIVMDPARRMCVSAATQLGKTQVTNAMNLVFANEVPISVVQTMPDRDLMFAFVQSRWQPMLDASPWMRDRVGRDTQNRSLWRMRGDGGNSNIHFLGCGSKVGNIGHAADKKTHDESDRSNPGTIGSMQGRGSASPYDITHYFTNPSITGTGSALILEEQSDLKRWFVPCGGCGEWKDLLDDWEIGEYHAPACIAGDEGDERYVCTSCGATITDAMREAGQWRATLSGTMFSGYRLSRLDSTIRTAAEVMADIRSQFANPYQLDPAQYVENFVLGRPWGGGGVEIGEEAMKAAQNRRGEACEMRNLKCDLFLGVDVHPKAFYTVGWRGDSIVHVEKVLRVGDDWSELDALMRRLRPKYTIVDAEPEHPQSEAFCRRWRNCAGRMFYREMASTAITRKEKNRDFDEWEADRTASLDAVGDTMRGNTFTIPASSTAVKEFVEHITKSLRRVLIVEEPKTSAGFMDNSRTKTVIRYVNPASKPDHFYHAANYGKMAQRVRAASSAGFGVNGGAERERRSLGELIDRARNRKRL